MNHCGGSKELRTNMHLTVLKWHRFQLPQSSFTVNLVGS